MRHRAWIWVSTGALAAVLFVACGGGTHSPLRASTPPEDIRVTAADFPNINTMTRVDDHFVGNLLGHLHEALAVARSPKGGRYPVGTIIQLVPQEAMVKRRAGFNAKTDDWEFFFLDVSAQGTKIVTRGVENVVNRFGGNCASCHSAARGQFDFVCGHDHGCAPLPIDARIIAALQAADPRPKS